MEHDEVGILFSADSEKAFDSIEHCRSRIIYVWTTVYSMGNNFSEENAESCVMNNCHFMGH